MSFGLLKHFKTTKSDVHQNLETRHIKHVILGQDLGAILELVALKRRCPEDSIKLISPRLLTKNILVEQYQEGVSLLRSQEAVTEIYRKYHSAKLEPQTKDALFYKDGKFHDFGGRAKSMELQPGEAFFLTRGYRMDVAGFFSEEEWANLDQLINESLELRIFEGIEKREPTDLVNIANWELTFKDFTKLTAENLYVSLSPKKFLAYLTHKEKLTPELIDACSSATIQAAISVTWTLNKEVHAGTETVFVPQSMTHEWGHFIVEFESFLHKSQEQICHCLFLIHDEDPQTEDLASRIKLLKRVMDRVFPGIEAAIKRESIRFDEEMLVSGIKDDLVEQLGFDYPTLKFLGQMSPMPTHFVNEKFLARTLLH